MLCVIITGLLRNFLLAATAAFRNRRVQRIGGYSSLSDAYVIITNISQTFSFKKIHFFDYSLNISYIISNAIYYSLNTQFLR